MGNSRNTRQKQVISQVVEGLHDFFSAEELHGLVQKVDNNIGIATVYRSLKDMSGQGKLHTYRCNRKTVYSHSESNHCHFFCEETGRTIHFNLDSLDFLRDKIPGDIRSIQIEVKGVYNGEKKWNRSK